MAVVVTIHGPVAGPAVEVLVGLARRTAVVVGSADPSSVKPPSWGQVQVFRLSFTYGTTDGAPGGPLDRARGVTPLFKRTEG